MSLNVKPSADVSAPLLPVALGTALVLVTYVSPLATGAATAADLGAASGGSAWILSSMSVGLTGALLAAGVIGDARGRRRVYVAGLLAVALGALGCALAPDTTVFVVARLVQGGGGGAVLACGLAALAHATPLGPARAHATAVWGASVGLGIGAGAILSAALDVGTGWRESYVATAVLALALLPVTLRRVADSRSAAPRRLDVPGLVLLVAGTTLLVAALTQGRDGINAGALALAALGLTALAALALVERRVATPLVEPELLGAPRLRAAATGSLSLGVGIIGMTAFVPTVTQLGLGVGLWPASILVLGWAGTSVATALLLPRLPFAVEGPRAIAGLLVVVAGGEAMGLGLTTGSSWLHLLAPMVVAGVGTGMLNALLGREAVASVPIDRAAMGSGANNTARYLGAACGITLFVSVATHAGTGSGASALVAGWNVAVAVAVALTLLGALLVLLLGRERGAVPAG